MATAVGALLCFACGFAIVRRLRFGAGTISGVLKSLLSFGFGLAALSFTYFLARVFGISNLFLADLVVLALLLCIFGFGRGITVANPPPSAVESDVGPMWFRHSLTAAVLVALGAAIYYAVMHALVHPHGDGWDAFSIWNLHARFLFRGGPNWRDGFTSLIPWSHPDYPLLLPAAIAHFWSYAGYEAPAVPAVIGFVFTFATAGILFSALSILRGRVPAALGTIALLSTPYFIEQGTSQYADVPLGFFYLATVVMLCMYDHCVGGQRWRLLALAGIAAVCAAWTKNEGLLFVASVITARVIILLRRLKNPTAGARGALRDLVPLFIAISLAILPVAYFKYAMAPPADIFPGRVSAVQKLLDPSRYWAIVKWYGKGFLRFGHWWLIPNSLLMIALYLVTGGDEYEAKPGSDTSWLALTLTLAGYFAIYLITPYDIYWHLRFSLTRLFLQLWPTALFLAFLGVGMAPTGHALSQNEPYSADIG